MKPLTLRMHTGKLEMQALMKDIRTEGVSVAYDEVRNRLLLQGEERHVDAMATLLRELDRPAPRYDVRIRVLKIVLGRSGDKPVIEIDPRLADVAKPLTEFAASWNLELSQNEDPTARPIAKIFLEREPKMRIDKEFLDWSSYASDDPRETLRPSLSFRSPDKYLSVMLTEKGVESSISVGIPKAGGLSISIDDRHLHESNSAETDPPPTSPCIVQLTPLEDKP